MNWKITAKKAAWDFVITCASVLLGYFASPEHLLETFPFLPLAVAPFISSFLTGLKNAVTHTQP